MEGLHELGFDLIAFLDLREVNGIERLEHGFVSAYICFGGDVNDDEFLEGFGVVEGELHGCFSAHGMSDDDGLCQLVVLDEGHDVVGEYVVVHFGTMWGTPVVSEVKEV